MNSLVEESPVVAAPSEKAAPKALRIAYLLSGYPAYSLTFVLNEVRGLKRLGFDIVTASVNPCDKRDEEMNEEEREEEAGTFYIKNAGLRAIVTAFFAALVFHPVCFFRGLSFTARLGGQTIRYFYFLEALIVGAWMRRTGRTHLHTHLGGSVASVAMIAARTFPITMSLTLHGPDEFWDMSWYYLPQKVAIASFVVCISSYGRSQCMLICPSSKWDKLVVARLGVDSAEFSPARRRLNKGLHTGPIEILCVGRLVCQKGQLLLVNALHRLVQDGRDVRLKLIGKGVERETLENTVAAYGLQDRVTFTGPLPMDQVREALETTDIFTLPSLAEGIPIALMEAMAMEIPCVSTMTTGIPELIRNEIDGLLVAPSDEIQLAEAFARLMDDPDLRRRLGAAGRQRVIANYELSRSVEALAEVFQCRL